MCKINLSMSDNYTIQEWSKLSKPKKTCFSCFARPSSNNFFMINDLFFITNIF